MILTKEEKAREPADCLNSFRAPRYSLETSRRSAKEMNQPNEYFAVIFTSMHTGIEKEAYSSMADRMVELASAQEGFQGMESARDDSGMGITVSYWDNEECIRNWKQNAEHLEAQKLGKEKWYQNFSLRIAKVIREYHFSPNADQGGVINSESLRSST